MESAGKAVFFCNVHMLMLSQEDGDLESAMASADFVIPDGVPVAWLQRWLGEGSADVFRGYEAVEMLCSLAASSGRAVGFLGSTDKVLQGMTEQLKQRHADLNIDYLYSPPLLGEEIDPDPELVEQINSKNLACLFVGLGCPKQEKWVAAYGSHLNCNLLAVGAAFDWLAGTTAKPPAWMEQRGLAWLFRLAQNPRRMWYRYLIYNSKFVLKSAKLLTWDKLGMKKSEKGNG